jgi:hypothetical protein
VYVLEYVHVYTCTMVRTYVRTHVLVLPWYCHSTFLTSCMVRNHGTNGTRTPMMVLIYMVQCTYTCTYHGTYTCTIMVHTCTIISKTTSTQVQRETSGRCQHRRHHGIRTKVLLVPWYHGTNGSTMVEYQWNKGRTRVRTWYMWYHGT